MVDLDLIICGKCNINIVAALKCVLMTILVRNVPLLLSSFSDLHDSTALLAYLGFWGGTIIGVGYILFKK